MDLALYLIIFSQRVLKAFINEYIDIKNWRHIVPIIINVIDSSKIAETLSDRFIK